MEFFIFSLLTTINKLIRTIFKLETRYYKIITLWRLLAFVFFYNDMTLLLMYITKPKEKVNFLIGTFEMIQKVLSKAKGIDHS